jgi:hypothetical protein
MRIRKYLIGAITGLVGAVAFASVASADVTNVQAALNISPAKQQKKAFNGASVFFSSTDTHVGELPCSNALSLSCRAFPPSVQTLLTFGKDVKFNPGNLPDCSLSQLVGRTTAGARQACPGSIVGQGSNLQLFSDGRLLNGTITAFNGAPSGGNPSLYLHVEFPGVTTKPILNAVIQGSRLLVQIPPVQGSVIENFSTTLNKRVVGKKRNKKTGKVQKLFYFSARCSKGNWPLAEQVTYQGGKQLTSNVSQKCTQKKKKKK